MSNTQLGTVYLRIMEDVIENCQTTFEEDGVSGQTLDDLKSTWQTKLSALKVGSFPWEPPPAPQPMANPTPVPSNVPRPNGLPPHGGPVASVPSNGEPRIKTEPGLEEKPNFGPNYENHDAQRRAMAQLQQKYGADANTQINKLASQINHTGQGRGQVYPQRPNMTPEQQRDQQAEYQRRQHAAAYQNMQRAQFAQSNGNHHDGSAEWSGYVNDQRKRAQESGHEADQTIRHQVDQMKRTMEGGGVLQPLSEQGAPVQVKRRKVDGADGAGETRVPQVDGAEEDDEDSKSNVKDELFEDDEDAINSDLDDPDDNEIEEEPEDGKPTQVMLCTYDKVQRVKNKWKCTLRDGVLNSGGKEYVFGKANGEFEW